MSIAEEELRVWVPRPRRIGGELVRLDVLGGRGPIREERGSESEAEEEEDWDRWDDGGDR